MKSRKEQLYARLRAKYPTYPDLVSQGLSFVQISEALGIGRKKLQKVKDAFDLAARPQGDHSIEVKKPRVKRQPVPPKPRLPPEEKLRLKYATFPDLMAQGLTRVEIMRELDVSAATIIRLKSAFGMRGRTFTRPTPIKPRREYPGIDEALRQGGSYAAIGARFGICREWVRQIAKAHGIEKVRAKAGQRKRTASGLTLYQHQVTEKYPDILNPNIVPCDITGPNEITVYKIRKILGISYSACHVSLSERIVSVIDRPMTISEIASALGSGPMNTLHMYLSMHTKNGRLKRISRGVYAPAKDSS